MDYPIIRLLSRMGVVVDDRVKYWIDLAEEDLSAAKALLNNNNLLHVAFNCHQVAEKSIKAVIARDLPEGEIPPKIHDLIKLASCASLMNILSNQQKSLLRELDPLNIEARYPRFGLNIKSKITKENCEKHITEVEQFLCWIKKQL